MQLYFKRKIIEFESEKIIHCVRIQKKEKHATLYNAKI